MIVGHEDTVESVTLYNYVSLNKEAIYALNAKSCVLIASYNNFIPDFWFCKKATVLKRLQKFSTEAFWKE